MNRGRPKKSVQVAPVAVHGTEKPKAVMAPAKESIKAEIAKWDTTIYHEEQEPRDIKEGDPIPDGWTTEPGTLSVLWKNNSDGSYFKTKR